VSQSKRGRPEVYLIALLEKDTEVPERIQKIWPDNDSYRLNDTSFLVVHRPEGEFGFAHEIYRNLLDDDSDSVPCIVAEVQDNFGYGPGSLWRWLEKLGR